MRAIANGIGIHYTIEGEGELVTLIHVLGLDLTMWEPQVAALRERYRVLRYDVRGHGKTDCPPGPYSLETLSEDLCGLLHALGITSTHVVGLSMGGMIAQQIALNAPGQVRSLVLADTASEYSLDARRLFGQRARTAEERGMEPLVGPAIDRWFTPEFRKNRPEVVDRVASILGSTNPMGYAATCRAIAELDLTERLQEVRVPSLVVVGEHDTSTPPESARLLHEHLPGSRFEIIPDAAHLTSLEQPARFSQLVLDFLQSVASETADEG